MNETIAIIGAGLAGATAARLLFREGAAVTVFEKSGGTGGRLSTRRTDYGPFDHGAQYINARGDGFRDTLAHMVAEGAAEQWSPAGKDRDGPWHVGMPGMSGLVKPMLGGIAVRTRTRIAAVSRDTHGIAIATGEGERERFDRVIVTAPAPQAFALVGKLDPAFGAIETATMAPCWSAMLAFGRRLDGLPDIRRGEDDSPLAWVARDSSKPGRESVENVVVHAGGAWSRAHLEDEPEAVLRLLASALDEAAGANGAAPVHAAAHRWRYARVDQAVGMPFVEGCDGRVIACGDWCLGGRAEAAFDSARLAAAHIVKHALV